MNKTCSTVQPRSFSHPRSTHVFGWHSGTCSPKKTGGRGTERHERSPWRSVRNDPWLIGKWFFHTEKGLNGYHLVMTNIAMENHHAINR